MVRDVGFDTISREMEHGIFFAIKLVGSLWWTISWELKIVDKNRVLATAWHIVDIQRTLIYWMNTWNYQTFALHTSVICLGALVG